LYLVGSMFFNRLKYRHRYDADLFASRSPRVTIKSKPARSSREKRVSSTREISKVRSLVRPPILKGL
jgi:hypothetical protein